MSLIEKNNNGLMFIGRKVLPEKVLKEGQHAESIPALHDRVETLISQLNLILPIPKDTMSS